MTQLTDAKIAIAPGADDNALCRWAYDAMSRGHRAARLADGAAMRPRRTVSSLRATVALVASDRRISATLRFDHGSLAIHDGVLGVPDVTLCGRFETIASLASLPMSRWARLPITRAWGMVALELFAGELKIYGLPAHPRLVLRVLRLLAP